MAYKLFPPGTRRRRNGKFNTSYIARGTVAGERFEVVTHQTTREAAAAWTDRFVVGLRGSSAAPEIVSFAYAASAYKAFKQPRRQDEANIDRLIAYFRPKDVGKDVRQIVGATLITAAHDLLPGRSNATKNRDVITPASAILHYAHEQKWCEDAHHRRLAVSRKSPRRPASDDAVAKVIAACDLSGTYMPQRNAYLKGPRQDRRAPHKRLLLAMLYETGLRVSDLLRLTDEDLDLPNGQMVAGSSKTDDAAWIGMSAELVALAASTPRMSEGRLFPWLYRQGVYKWLRPLVRRLGVTYTPHLSRHAMATELRKAGKDRKQIAERGIWRDERSVDRYIHHRAVEAPERSASNVLSGVKSGVQRGSRRKTGGGH